MNWIYPASSTLPITPLIIVGATIVSALVAAAISNSSMTGAVYPSPILLITLSPIVSSF